MLLATRLTRTLISDYDKFPKPEAAERLSDFAITKELKRALENIGEARGEAAKLDLPEDSSINCQLRQTELIIRYIIRCME
jgi:hypothetical protein